MIKSQLMRVYKYSTCFNLQYSQRNPWFGCMFCKKPFWWIYGKKKILLMIMINLFHLRNNCLVLYVKWHFQNKGIDWLSQLCPNVARPTKRKYDYKVDAGGRISCMKMWKVKYWGMLLCVVCSFNMETSNSRFHPIMSHFSDLIVRYCHLQDKWTDSPWPAHLPFSVIFKSVSLGIVYLHI